MELCSVLEVQKYLLSQGLEKLKEEFKIEVREHPTDDRILLNYCQINSPRNHPVTNDCRGLCLNKKDFSLIARSFRRFFNYGEFQEDDKLFNWDNCICQSKEDGTLISLYYYQNKWRVQTRASFGDIPYYPGGPTPEELVFGIIGKHPHSFSPLWSYSLELCSLHNKIVKEYKSPELFLLSIFDGEDEWSYERIKSEYHSWLSHISFPSDYTFQSIKDVKDYIELISKTNPTWEGIVVRDSNNNRLKVKSPEYIRLHCIGSIRTCLFHPRYLIDYILKNETGELLSVYGEVKPTVDSMVQRLNEEYIKTAETWEWLKYAETDRDFHESMPKGLTMKSVLTTMRKTGLSLNEVWHNSKDQLLKSIFKVKP